MLRICSLFAVASSISLGALASTYSINVSAAGRRLDGFGAISGGGATSRLLFSYKEPFLSDILDFLFLPSHGAALHHLKVEVGGDGQSSEGVEPSHAHFEGDGVFTRGYEWRLMVEAKKRNPAILISALAWTWPGWLGLKSPWDNCTKSTAYLVAWVRAARDVYNVSVDFIDADWNERGWSAEFVLALRAALDVAGFSKVGIVCGDDAHHFSCSAAVAANATLRAAVVALGVHGPDAPDAVAVGTGVPLWGSEVHAPDPGGADLVSVFSNLYATFNVTGFLLWNALSAYNEGLFSPDWGIFRAWWPWAGHYELDGRAWVFAHWTQGTAPGWRFIDQQSGGAGNLTNGGSWTALVDVASGGLTLVISKPLAGTSAELADFHLSSSGSPLPATLHAMRSIVIPGADFGRNLTDYFVKQPDIIVRADGSFSLSLSPGDLWTVSTVSTMHKGGTASGALPPPVAPFPPTWADNFDSCPLTQEAPYFTDQTGVWECVGDAARGTVMRQVVPMKPLGWRPDEQRPFTIFAANISWSDVDVSIDVRLASSTDVALIGARANPNCCGRVITGEDFMPGAWVAVSADGWVLYNAISNVTTEEGVLARGSLSPKAPAAGEWHTLRLIVGETASFFFDGAVQLQGFNLTQLVPVTGFVGIGTGNWGQFVDFDRFNVSLI